MSVLHPHEPPASGLKGLKENWHNDLLAAFSVSMVSLPLSLGIAIAAGAGAMAGLISALIAGLVTTFVRGSHIAINGPGNGLIAVILAGIISLQDGSGNAFQYVLAAVVVAGIIQVGIGLLKLGKLGELFPSSVIGGILAAIGVIIMGKQIHVALGASTDAKNILGVLAAVPASILQINPAIFIIASVSLLILIVYPKLENKLIHFVPAPMWVLLVAIPLAMVLPSSKGQEGLFFSSFFGLETTSYVAIPKTLFSNFLFPNFSRVADPAFWGVVLSICLINSVETLISTKAIDKLDPYKRTTDPNKELVGTGLSSILSGAIGGLPIVTVIARSSVNIHNSAKTRWSNFFSGVFLLLFVLLFAPVINRVPLGALAAILIYTGFKLTAPKVYKDAKKRGWEQLLFMVVTLVSTLYTNLIWGLVIGTIFTYLFHNIRLGLSPGIFLKSILQDNIASRDENGKKIFEVKGVLNFANILKTRSLLEAVPKGSHVRLDFTKAQMVDLTTLEFISSFAEEQKYGDGSCELVGLDLLQKSCSYPQALRVYGVPSLLEDTPEVPLSKRQVELQQLSDEQGWSYKREIDWDASYLRNFQFFETRPLEYKENILQGHYDHHEVRWEIADLTFDEGAVLVEEYHTTAQVLYLPYAIPEFVVEREELFDRLMELVGHEDIDFHYFTDFSKKFVVKGYSHEDVEQFFTPSTVKFFDTHDIYHLESNGEALLVFRKFRLERMKGIMEMHDFCGELLLEILPQMTRAKEESLKNLPEVSEEKDSSKVEEKVD